MRRGCVGSNQGGFELEVVIGDEGEGDPGGGIINDVS